MLTITDGIKQYTVEGVALPVPGNPALLKAVIKGPAAQIHDFIQSGLRSTDSDVSSPKTIDIFTPEAAYRRFLWETLYTIENDLLLITGRYLGSASQE